MRQQSSSRLAGTLVAFFSVVVTCIYPAWNMREGRSQERESSTESRLLPLPDESTSTVTRCKTWATRWVNSKDMSYIFLFGSLAMEAAACHRRSSIICSVVARQCTVLAVTRLRYTYGDASALPQDKHLNVEIGPMLRII